MRAYVIRRLLLIPLVAFVISVMTFTMIRALPGDAAIARLGATGQQCETCMDKVRKELGLDKSKPEQYWIWLRDAVRLDFGLSTSTGQPVTKELGERVLNTFEVGLVTILFTLLLGIPIGAISAVRRGTMSDNILRFFSILGLSVPSFWIATLVISLPVIWWNGTWVTDWVLTHWVTFNDNPLDNIKALVLPALILAIGGSAYVARITRSSMIEAMSSDHVRTARAKGLHERAVVLSHVMRNSMLTLLTVIGIQFGAILGGSVIIETVFSIPGIGAWLVTAVGNRDYQIVQAIAVVFALWFLFITLVTDVMYAWVDPRIRY